MLFLSLIYYYSNGREITSRQFPHNSKSIPIFKLLVTLYSATTHLSGTAQPVQYPANKKQNILDRKCRSLYTHCFAIMIGTEQLDPQTVVKNI